MSLAIPRGIIYHRVVDDLKWLVRALFRRLDDETTVSEFALAFARLVGCRFAVAFPFARTAIYFALKSRNLPKGAEVIMPPISIKGILDVVLELGLKPVFVDIEPDTLCFKMEDLRRAISDNTQAIIVTYLYGIVPDVEQILSLCRESKLFIIEDFSQCLNGKFKGKKVGGFGHVGVYSASSIKTLDTYGGGLLVCDDESIYAAMDEERRRLSPPERVFLVKKIFTDLVRNVATTRLVFGLVVFPLLKLLNYFKPNSVLKQTGDRYAGMIHSLPQEWFTAYTSLQAAAGLEFIKRLETDDQGRLKNVRTIKASTSTRFPAGVAGGENIYWQLIVYFDDSAEMQKRLHRYGIDTARTSLLQISDLAAYPYRGNTPNAASLYTAGLFIPSYPGLSDADIKRIVTALRLV